MCAAKAKKFLMAEIKAKEARRKREAKEEREQDLLDEAERNETETTSPNLEKSRDAGKEVAKTYGVSHGNVYTASKVLKESPELAAQVERGEITVNKASQSLNDKKCLTKGSFYYIDRLRILSNEICNSGGIEDVTQGWSPRDRSDFCVYLKRLHEDIGSWILYLDQESQP
jgi:hypothetical protein